MDRKRYRTPTLGWLPGATPPRSCEVDYPHRHTGDAPPGQDLPSAVPPSSAAPAEGAGKVTHDGYVIHCDLPKTWPVTKEWVALLRAYLGPEINAILFGDEKT